MTNHIKCTLNNNYVSSWDTHSVAFSITVMYPGTVLRDTCGITKPHHTGLEYNFIINFFMQLLSLSYSLSTVIPILLSMVRLIANTNYVLFCC